MRRFLISLIPFTVLDILILFTDDGWLQESLWAQDFVNGGLYLSSIGLAAGVAYWSMDAFNGLSFADVAKGGARQVARLLLRQWVPPFLAALLIHDLISVLLVFITVLSGSTSLADLLGFLPPIGPIALSSAIGIASAVALKGIWATVFAAVVSFALSFASSAGLVGIKTGVGGAMSSLAGFEFSLIGILKTLWPMLALSVAILTLAGFLLLNSAGLGGSLMSFLSLGLIMILTALVPSASSQLVPKARPDRACSSRDGLSVCVLVERARVLESVTEAVSIGTALLQRLGVDPERIYTEPAPGDRPADFTTAVLLLPAEFTRSSSIDGSLIASLISYPAACSAYFYPEADAAFPMMSLNEELERAIEEAYNVGVENLEDERVATILDAYEELRDCTSVDATRADFALPEPG